MKRRACRMGVGEIHIGERQRSGRNIDNRIRRARCVRNFVGLMNRGIGRQHRRIVGAGDRDGDGLCHRDAVVVLDRDRIDLRDRLTFGQRLQRGIVVVQREVPANRALIVGVGGALRHRINGECSDLGRCRGISGAADKTWQS